MPGPTRSPQDDLLKGTLDMLVLRTLTVQPMHGYAIAQHIERLSDGVFAVEQGSLYPALQRLRGLTLHGSDDDAFLVYSRRVSAEHSPTGVEDVVLVVVNLDPHAARETTIHLDLPALGIDPGAPLRATDLLNGEKYTWGEHAYVRLGPGHCAHVVHVTPLLVPGPSADGAPTAP